MDMSWALKRVVLSTLGFLLAIPVLFRLLARKVGTLLRIYHGRDRLTRRYLPRSSIDNRPSIGYVTLDL
jgi:hypothetical protein